MGAGEAADLARECAGAEPRADLAIGPALVGGDL
jgi:hypothetical protein